jgi:hypothetical protein
MEDKISFPTQVFRRAGEPIDHYTTKLSTAGNAFYYCIIILQKRIIAKYYFLQFLQELLQRRQTSFSRISRLAHIGGECVNPCLDNLYIVRTALHKIGSQVKPSQKGNRLNPFNKGKNVTDHGLYKAVQK